MDPVPGPLDEPEDDGEPVAEKITRLTDEIRKGLAKRAHLQSQIQESAGLTGGFALNPEGWEYRTIQSVCSKVTSGGTPSRRRADYYGGDGEYLFMGVHPGEPPTPSSMQHHWRQTIKVARVTGYRPHDLRHFFASGLIADGADVVAVQKQLGHKRPSITLDTYAHLWHTSEEVTRSAAGRLMQQSLSTDAVKWTESS